jgi:hypothetical protein
VEEGRTQVLTAGETPRAPAARSDPRHANAIADAEVNDVVSGAFDAADHLVAG